MTELKNNAGIKPRINWIDTARFWGMFFVYIGHFGPEAGHIYTWVWHFHVPLFFFLSGCVENYNNRGFLENLRHKAIHTLIPFYFFGLISVVYAAIKENSYQVLQNNLEPLLLGGVRNSIVYGVGLWFLTCLFVIQIVFSLLKKIRYRSVVLLICLGFYLLAEYVMSPRPIKDPQWFYNVDSACYYILFYGLGWFFCPLINKTLASNSLRVMIPKAVITAAGLAYTIYLFFGRDLLRPLWGLHPVFSFIRGIFVPMICIWLVAMVSYCFPYGLMKHIGCNSLYMCGNEYIIKNFFPLALSLFGVSRTFDNPIQAYLYVLILLVITDRILVPVEKPMLEWLQGVFRRMTEKKA